MYDDPLARLKDAQARILAGDFQGAVSVGARALLCDNHPEAAFNLLYARWKYRLGRRGAPTRLAVCGWDLSHNAAGRVRALADIHRVATDTEIIGTLFHDWGGNLWGPIRGGDIPVHTISVPTPQQFLTKALDLVCEHPYDVVHLSKPRMPNIVYGLLYKMIWGSRVIMDIDDEELAFTTATNPLPIDALGDHPDWAKIRRHEWTRVAVGCAGMFDAVTVSNVALQNRYGGHIIPHARDGAQFGAVDATARANYRNTLGIGTDDFVVVFLGTPRAHKGLIETARALASLNRRDVHFLIVGDFDDPALKDQVMAVDGVAKHFLPNQPFAALPQVLSTADACVLLQETNTLVSQFQFPAKLVDALAARLVTFVSVTEPLMPLVRDDAVVAVRGDDLACRVARFIDDLPARRRQAGRGHEWFLRHLSRQSCQTNLANIVHAQINPPPLEKMFDNSDISKAFSNLGLFNSELWGNIRHMMGCPSPDNCAV